MCAGAGAGAPTGRGLGAALRALGLDRETLAAVWVICLYTSTPYCWLFTLYMLTDRRLTLLILGYLVWILAGPGRRAAGRATWTPHLKRWPLYKYLARYFNAELIKTAELDPGRSYILGVHPHGVLTLTAWLNFASDGTGFSKLFPGIDAHAGTLSWNFTTPIAREYCLLHGMCDVSKATLRDLLSRPGRAVAIAIGGAAEALHADNGTYNLILKKRKGFIKVAMEKGAAVVPVFCFGENEVLTTVHTHKGGLLWALQGVLKATAGFTLPLAHGKGLLGLRYGLVPHRRRIVTVVGAPIEVPHYKGDFHTPEAKKMVDEAHARYMAAVRGLWDKYKGQYARERRQSLTIIE